MLSKDKRLNLKKDFKWVAAGERSENSLLKIFFRYGQEETPKVGIALSKTSFKKAVERNRARRLISKGFESLYCKLPSGINIIALPKNHALALDSDKVSALLEELLIKNKILKDG